MATTRNLGWAAGAAALAADETISDTAAVDNRTVLNRNDLSNHRIVSPFVFPDRYRIRGQTTQAPLFRARRRHFQRPNRHRTHVHSGAEVACDVPGLRRAEPVAPRLVDHVIKAPGGFPGFVRHTV